MARKTILLIGTLDTKGVEFAYIRDLIAARGHATLVLDAGVGEPQWAPDIGAERVATAGGGDLAELRAANDRAAALDVMCRGARAVALELLADGRVDGVIGLGGQVGRRSRRARCAPSRSACPRSWCRPWPRGTSRPTSM